MKKIYLLFLFFTGFCINRLNAQSDLKLSVLAMQPMAYNPAYAGSYEGTSFSAMHSSQWTGFEGAPATQFLTGSFRFNNQKVGAGFLISNDNIGPVNEFRIEGNYSFTVNLSDDLMLSMGLKAGLNNFLLDYSKLNIQDSGEIENYQTKQSKMTPLIGGGFYLFTDKFFIGASIPSGLATNYFNENTIAIKKRAWYMYHTTGYRFKMDDELFLTPMLQYRYTVYNPSKIVLMSNLEWKDKIFVGLNSDFDASFGAFFAFRFLEDFKIAYAYDTSVNTFSEYNNGGHAFKLIYELPNKRLQGKRPFTML